MPSDVAIKPFAIFDMDGTRVDSMGCWHRVYTEFLLTHGAGDSAKSVATHIAHMTTYEASALFRDLLSLDDSIEDIAAALNGRMAELYRSEVQEKIGARAWLDRLKDQGVRMCVVSSTPEVLIRACLSRLDLMPFFSFILSCDTIGKGKEEPDAYLAAAQRLGALPHETAVYEDAPVALLTAKKAGFYAVAVYDGPSADAWEKMCETADAAVRDWRLI